MTVTIKPLSPGLVDDFLYFFDHRAFIDNPDWAGCYCMYFFNTGTEEDFGARDEATNRKEATELIRQGGMQGYLAYIGKTPVGWCNVNRKDTFPFLIKDKRLLSPEDSRCRAITCFTVDPAHRREGIARLLLNHIIEEHDRHFHGILEAYPRNNPSGDAEHYHGPMSLYLSAGFTAVKTLEGYTILRYIGR